MHYTARFEDALVYAHQLHAHQKRKQTDIPYISHLLAVTAIVIENGGTEDEAIAALLHDAIEDAGGDAVRHEIRVRFGERVLTIVEGCTDADEWPKPPWLARKQAYIEHLRAEPDPSIRLVSLADKVHNVQSILRDYRVVGDRVWERFTGKRDGSVWYYRSLLQVFQAGGSSPLIDEFARLVSELEQLP